MKKRVLSIMVLLLLLVSMLPIVSASALIGPQYVSTSNGKGLNLRSGPSKNDKVIATIPYGAELDSCEYYDSAWSAVTYKNYNGYCMTRYLSSTKPSAKPTPTPTPSETVSFKNFTKTDYYVNVRPSTPSGFVNLRWAPSKKMAIQTTYYAGYTLHVLAQDKTWAQVYDESSDICGFMMRAFLTDAGDGTVVGSESGT